MSIESVMLSSHSHPLLTPPPALNLSQHQGLFQWVGSSHQVVTVLELQLQPFQWIFRIDFLLDWLVWSPCCPRDSSTIVQKQQFFGAQPSLWSHSHIHKWLLEKPQLWWQTFVSKVMSLLFDMVSRFVIAFLPRSKRLLISWLQSPSAVILEPPEKKSLPLFLHLFALKWWDQMPWS